MVLIVLEPLEEAEGSPVEDFTSGALQDNFLIDFRHFCRLSGEREDIPYDELALAYRFQELDPEDTGYVTVGDFTYDSLWALLKRRYSRARALFRAWDEATNSQKRTDIKRIMIVGAGPNVIGQACEFDYSGTQACKSLRCVRAPYPPDRRASR